MKNCEYASFIVVSPVIQVNVCLLYIVPVQTSKPELCLIKQDFSVSMLALGLNVSFGWQLTTCSCYGAVYMSQKCLNEKNEKICNAAITQNVLPALVRSFKALNKHFRAFNHFRQEMLIGFSLSRSMSAP